MELYNPEKRNKFNFRTKKPLRVAIVTSLRDIIREDRNGCLVDTSSGKIYMMGLIEALARGINNNVAGMGLALQIVGIVYDDTETDVSKMSAEQIDITLTPSTSNNWLHPHNLMDIHTGELLIDKTYNLPSEWRSLPKNSKARLEAKSKWESRLEHTVFNELNADVLLSDHLMIVLEKIVKKEYGYLGRLLNIHPAITNINDPDNFRGATPTYDAIKKAQREGHCFTGSTLHYLTSEIDSGTPIAAAKETPVFAQDTLQDVRAKNYTCKIAVAIAGLIHYREYLMNQTTTTDFASPHKNKTRINYTHWISKLAPIFNKTKYNVRAA